MIEVAPAATAGDRIRVIAAVIRRGDKLLVCQRPFAKRHGGLWEFPGGKCELGESDFDAARRELREELAVEVTRVGEVLASFEDDGSRFEIVFVPVEVDGDPICQEHLAFRWATLADLIELNLAPSDRQFVVHQADGEEGLT